jgi:hypothetical protein
MIEDRIITVMSAFELIDDKLESIKILINSGLIDAKLIQDYSEIIYHLMAIADSNDDIDIIAKELVSIFGPYMAAADTNTNEISTLYDFISDGVIDLISEYGTITRNEFLNKLKYYGCKPILELSNEEYDMIIQEYEMIDL